MKRRPSFGLETVIDNEENPLLVALGATPRGSTLPPSRDWTAVVGIIPSTSSSSTIIEDHNDHVKDNIHHEEEGGKHSIEPIENHPRSGKDVLRREIVIVSPGRNTPLDNDEVHSMNNSPLVDKSILPPMVVLRQFRTLGFDYQPVDLILYVFSFLVESDDFHTMSQVSCHWRDLTNSLILCRILKNIKNDGSVNWYNFQNFGIKNKGTEGTCFKCRQRSTGKLLAMKRARVFPKGEGVPYYMLRELAVLQGMNHPHIAALEIVSLAQDELHVFFPYVPQTLHEVINPSGDPTGGTTLPPDLTRVVLHQLLDAIAYCHRRGVLHRNLKPKHVLLTESLLPNEVQLQLSDFALVRATGIPRRTYTVEVVTLWYRPPEILMGVRGYSRAVDIWSIGCIFAEMVQGKPLFTGISEIDQLFQIFSKLSTPTVETWSEFTELPHYQNIFPNWKSRPLTALFPKLCPTGIDLLSKLLAYDPDVRITAEEALRHPYFAATDSSPALIPHVAVQAVPTWSLVNEPTELYHAYLRESEMSLSTEFHYLDRQKALRPMHRSMLVDWLIEVVDVFEMCPRTAFLAVNYTDRYLERVLVKRHKFQLLGATCLHVASKCEDVSYIGVEDLAMCADNVYNSSQVLEMEEKLLNTLSFSLSIPTSLDFLNIYISSLLLDKITEHLAHYFAELALQEYSFLSYRPSLVATCCLSLALYCMEKEHWTVEVSNTTRYTWKELKECMEELQVVYSNSTFSVLLVIKKRYMTPERHQVSARNPPPRFTMSWDK